MAQLFAALQGPTSVRAWTPYVSRALQGSTPHPGLQRRVLLVGLGITVQQVQVHALHVFLLHRVLALGRLRDVPYLACLCAAMQVTSSGMGLIVLAKRARTEHIPQLEI
jgi:hypothetical protein